MDKTIDLRGISGTFRAPPSKSAAHRLLILAALCGSPVFVRLSPVCGDVEATVRCLNSLGADIRRTGEGYFVEPIRSVPDGKVTLDCGESGSTLRFLIPVAAALGADAVFTGTGRLPERPLAPILTALREHGVTDSSDGRLPSEIHGRPEAGEYRVPGNISSQFATGLLLALPLLPGSSIRITPPVESARYLDITIDALSKFGYSVRKEAGADGSVLFTPENGSRLISPGEITVEGDWSGGAFFICLGALSAKGITVTGLDMNSPQGDRAIIDIVRKTGADVTINGDTVTTRKNRLNPVSIDVRDIPDLAPCLAALMAFCGEVSGITNAGRLRLKESDRISTTAALLKAAGITVTEKPDGLTITGGKNNPEFTVSSFGDHRICMAAAVLASDAKVTVTQAEAVKKSWPGFFDLF
ncbi:MAG: 3-phosphoshikimate 1-carboxyvinyltransferase [Clostridia bacterium]|nr:3-phosphoshikimate 1-carboxyvinyltransferase [Clostridia bacterium]